MKYLKVRRLQKAHGYRQLQEQIDNGSVWHLQGLMVQQAMSALQSGACMLPKASFRDAYGNKVPSRDELVRGAKGTFQNSNKYYEELWKV